MNLRGGGSHYSIYSHISSGAGNSGGRRPQPVNHRLKTQPGAVIGVIPPPPRCCVCEKETTIKHPAHYHNNKDQELEGDWRGTWEGWTVDSKLNHMKLLSVKLNSQRFLTRVFILTSPSLGMLEQVCAW